MSESAGRVLMIPKGTYSPTTTYDPLDAVKYEQNSYVCKQTSRGNLPTNTTYWQPLTDVTADENPTEDSTNLVQSGGVYSALTTINQTLTNQVKVNGAVNILPNSFADAVMRGVTLSNNTDGTLNVSGTNDGTGNGFFNSSNFKVPDSGLYKMTGLPGTVAGSSIIDLYLWSVTDSQNVSPSATYIQDYIYNLDSSKTYRAVIVVYKGKTVPSGTIIKPMISVASLNLSYADYVPYAMPNKELTDDVTRLTDDVTRLDRDAVKIVASGLIDANSSGSFTCTNYEGYRLSIYSLGENAVGMIVLFGKHPSVSDVRFSTFNCENRNPDAPQVSVSGSTLTITTTSSNCYYVIERI